MQLHCCSHINHKNLIIGKDYESKGCWKENPEFENGNEGPRALKDIDKDIDESYGYYNQRTNPKQNCLDAALGRNFKFFALQDGGQCFGTNDEAEYKQYGEVVGGCDPAWNGKGSGFINHVYAIKTGKFFEAVYKECINKKNPVLLIIIYKIS